MSELSDLGRSDTQGPVDWDVFEFAQGQLYGVHEAMGARHPRAVFSSANDARYWLAGIEATDPRYAEYFYVEDAQKRPVHLRCDRPGHAYALIEKLNQQEANDASV